ncbi:MAG: hypothetical protein E7K04_01400 [Helicobacter sp.]|nr:hypothetical protein [Helicobacter sp.]
MPKTQTIQLRLMRALKITFIAHFIIDLIFALPLLFYPKFLFILFDFQSLDLITPRIIGSALFAIGTISLLVQNASKEVFISFLKFKLLWSSSCVLALFLGLIGDEMVLQSMLAKASLIGALVIFAIFFSIWLFFYLKLK